MGEGEGPSVEEESDDRAWFSSCVVKAVMETLEGMEVMELKRESRRERSWAERMDMEELRK